jgi:hypothetical protein
VGQIGNRGRSNRKLGGSFSGTPVAGLSWRSCKRLPQWSAHNLVTFSIAVPSEAGAAMDKTRRQPPGTKFACAANTSAPDSKSGSNGDVQSKTSSSKTSRGKPASRSSANDVDVGSSLKRNGISEV